ncbi:MAG: DUF1624 domain-containing protein [Planctomycetaceae bacterium]|nr:DUF1624 domain-containing protein [Planctomycetaceae bacterium]
MTSVTKSLSDRNTAGVEWSGDVIARPRMDSVDMLRGLAIVLMSLDHVREFLSAAQIAPTDVAQTTPALFFTRWVTHFCAPIFVFLAGTGAYLYRTRGKTAGQAAVFLLTRGLWLVVLELTVIRFAWFFNMHYGTYSLAQVIWTIGWSMVVMAALVFLPIAAIAAFGVLLIAFHNLFDPVAADSFGAWAWLWRFLHDGGGITPLPGMYIHVAYPLIPWVGVMAAGYAFGALMQLPQEVRRVQTFSLGVMLTLTFLVLRWTNVYGDPAAWSVQPESLRTVLSFLNLQKYPPSLLFLLMTLGPALIVLAFADRPAGPCGRFLITFGRVPLFFYILHLYVIHALALGLVYLQTGETPDWLFSFPPGHAGTDKDGHPCGVNLLALYGIWIAVVVGLYPLCRWFAGIKRRRGDFWLSYL